MAPFPFKFKNRSLKVAITITGLLIVIPLAMQLWFKQNARAVLEQYISEKSNGKIKLKLAQLDLNLLSKRLQIEHAELSSNDSLVEPITYHVTFNKISLSVRSIWSLLFRKELYLDSLKLYDPVIEVMQWRKDTSGVAVEEELSIPQEMGKFYNLLLYTLDRFSVRRVLILDAKVSLINKIKSKSEPVTVSNIFFDLARTPIIKGKEIIYSRNNQKIELRTGFQNIALPGGRHRLSFKAFKLQLLRERIELDSCTITANPTDSSKSNYKIFFKKLSLTGVDFNAMSANNLIKADTVYCENPFFNLNLYRSDALINTKQLPDPDKLIRELTGNFELAFIGMKDAGIQFEVFGKTKRSILNSSKDDFQIEGLKITPESAHPATMSHFDMTLRDYHLYNEDSSSIFSFDSLHFLNSKVVLNNFAIRIRPGRNNVRHIVDIRVPYFALSELDWYQLIFEQNMVAKQAVLNSPVINFTHGKMRESRKKLNLFATLQNLDSLVTLENVSVINGKMSMHLGQETSFTLENLNFKVLSKKLLQSTDKEGLRSAVENLSFSKGVLRLRDITAQLQNASLTNNNIVYADRIAISGKGDKLMAVVNQVHINNLQSDDNAENIEVEEFGWESANVSLKALPLGKQKNQVNSSIHLKNIQGNNTQFYFTNGHGVKLSAYIDTLHATSILNKGNDLVHVEGFNLIGKGLLLNSNAVTVNADTFNVSDARPSMLMGIKVQQIKGHDSLTIYSQQVDVAANLNDVFANKMHFATVQARNPVITLSKWDKESAGQQITTIPSDIRIDRFVLLEPDVTISIHAKDSVTVINVPRSVGSSLQASDIILSPEYTSIQNLVLNTAAATLVKPTGIWSGIDNGKIDLKVSNLQFVNKNGKINWSGFIDTLSLGSSQGVRVGKGTDKLRFEKLVLGSLVLSHDNMPDFDRLLKDNFSAWLFIPAGEYTDSIKTLKWFNASYQNSTETLSFDSVAYHPVQSLDSVLAHAPYELDYITAKSGVVTVAGFDFVQFKKDGSIKVDTIKIANPVLHVYRDKKPPFSPFKKAKPLPVNMIRNMSNPVAVQGVLITDGIITYTEKNEKSRKEGSLTFTKVNGSLTKIKNRNFLIDDSIFLSLNGKFMDEADIDLSVRESYLDSLSGFTLNAKIKSAVLSILNPVLVPLLNVKITSGVLDSVSLDAIGRDDLALGEMNMHYRKLRIQFRKNGSFTRSTFLQKLLNIAANTFIIKSNNYHRTGIVYSKRSADQSFVNYIVQTGLSGVLSSIGIKSNNGYIKQYKRELIKSDLPPIKH